MRRIYESITDCLQDYRNTVSRTKGLKITFDNILSDQEHAEQFKIRINQAMLLPHHFDLDFFYAGKRENGIRILSVYGFTKLNHENIFDYNFNNDNYICSSVDKFIRQTIIKTSDLSSEFLKCLSMTDVYITNSNNKEMIATFTFKF